MGDVVSSEVPPEVAPANETLESRGDVLEAEKVRELNENLPQGEEDPQRRADAEAQKKKNEPAVAENLAQARAQALKSKATMDDAVPGISNNMFDEGSGAPETSQDKVNDTVQETAGIIEEMQKENGEAGLPLEESPKTSAKLQEKIGEMLSRVKEGVKNNKMDVAIIISSLLSFVIGKSITGAFNRKEKKWHKNNTPKFPVGCLRVNVETGEISWPPKDRQCGVGGATSGVCDKTAGNSAFCDITQYPVAPCQVTYSQCADISAGGGCALDDGEQNGEFTYIPVCGDMNLLFSASVMINQNKDLFVPKKTPVFLTVISLIFIALLVVTVAWYLYKDVKKILDRNK